MGFKKDTETFKHCKVQKKLLSGIKLLCHTQVIMVSNRGAVKNGSPTLAERLKKL